jgi:hypothetical protein
LAEVGHLALALVQTVDLAVEAVLIVIMLVDLAHQDKVTMVVIQKIALTKVAVAVAVLAVLEHPL